MGSREHITDEIRRITSNLRGYSMLAVMLWHVACALLSFVVRPSSSFQLTMLSVDDLSFLASIPRTGIIPLSFVFATDMITLCISLRMRSRGAAHMLPETESISHMALKYRVPALVIAIFAHIALILIILTEMTKESIHASKEVQGPTLWIVLRHKTVYIYAIIDAVILGCACLDPPTLGEIVSVGMSILCGVTLQMPGMVRINLTIAWLVQTLRSRASISKDLLRRLLSPLIPVGVFFTITSFILFVVSTYHFYYTGVEVLASLSVLRSYTTVALIMAAFCFSLSRCAPGTCEFGDMCIMLLTLFVGSFNASQQMGFGALLGHLFHLQTMLSVTAAVYFARHWSYVCRSLGDIESVSRQRFITEITDMENAIQETASDQVFHERTNSIAIQAESVDFTRTEALPFLHNLMQEIAEYCGVSALLLVSPRVIRTQDLFAAMNIEFDFNQDVPLLDQDGEPIPNGAVSTIPFLTMLRSVDATSLQHTSHTKGNSVMSLWTTSLGRVRWDVVFVRSTSSPCSEQMAVQFIDQTRLEITRATELIFQAGSRVSERTAMNSLKIVPHGVARYVIPSDLERLGQRVLAERFLCQEADALVWDADLRDALNENGAQFIKTPPQNSARERGPEGLEELLQRSFETDGKQQQAGEQATTRNTERQRFIDGNSDEARWSREETKWVDRCTLLEPDILSSLFFVRDTHLARYRPMFHRLTERIRSWQRQQLCVITHLLEKAPWLKKASEIFHNATLSDLYSATLPDLADGKTGKMPSEADPHSSGTDIVLCGALPESDARDRRVLIQTTPKSRGIASHWSDDAVSVSVISHDRGLPRSSDSFLSLTAIYCEPLPEKSPDRLAPYLRAALSSLRAMFWHQREALLLRGLVNSVADKFNNACMTGTNVIHHLRQPLMLLYSDLHGFETHSSPLFVAETSENDDSPHEPSQADAIDRVSAFSEEILVQALLQDSLSIKTPILDTPESAVFSCILQHAQMFMEKDITPVVRIEPGLPDRVTGPGRKLMLALSSLIRNAVTRSPRSDSIVITVRSSDCLRYKPHQSLPGSEHGYQRGDWRCKTPGQSTPESGRLIMNAPDDWLMRQTVRGETILWVEFGVEDHGELLSQEQLEILQRPAFNGALKDDVIDIGLLTIGNAQLAVFLSSGIFVVDSHEDDGEQRRQLSSESRSSSFDWERGGTTFTICVPMRVNAPSGSKVCGCASFLPITAVLSPNDAVLFISPIEEERLAVLSIFTRASRRCVAVDSVSAAFDFMQESESLPVPYVLCDAALLPQIFFDSLPGLEHFSVTRVIPLLWVTHKDPIDERLTPFLSECSRVGVMVLRPFMPRAFATAVVSLRSQLSLGEWKLESLELSDSARANTQKDPIHPSAFTPDWPLTHLPCCPFNGEELLDTERNELRALLSGKETAPIQQESNGDSEQRPVSRDQPYFLIIHDSSAVQTAIKTSLISTGLAQKETHIMMAGNGLDGMTKFREWRQRATGTILLGFLDIATVDYSAFQLAEMIRVALRGEGRWTSLLAVVPEQHRDDDDLLGFFDGVVTTPVNSEALFAECKRIINSGATGPERHSVAG